MSKALTRHFLTGTELGPMDLERLLKRAEELREERIKGKFRQDLAGRTVALLFEKPSLRTHLSFVTAIRELGGHAMESFSMNRKKEEPEDVARVVSGYADAIMLRTHEHSILERMAAKSGVAIINGLSDTHHPCQILADLLTLKQSYGEIKGLTVSYLGDGNNILHSLMLLLPYLGVNLYYACPKGYEPSALVLKQARRLAAEGKATIKACVSPMEAAEGADALYTDVWTSMGFEEEEARRELAFQGYQLNAELYAKAKSNALIMHCLPMIRGKEITEEMVEHPRSAIFRQSENRLHVQKSLLLELLGGNRAG
jgi:ornithine carbamoyltransferase